MADNKSTKQSTFQEITCLTLKSSDGQTFQIDVSAALKSGYLVKEMQANPGENEFYINEIDGKLLKKIVEYLTFYKDSKPKEIPRPLPDYRLDKILDKFDYDFINSFPLSDCVEFLNAVENLEINSLVRLMCARIASKMMELPIEEVRKIFGIETDMTEDEKLILSKYQLY